MPFEITAVPPEVHDIDQRMASPYAPTRERALVEAAELVRDAARPKPSRNYYDAAWQRGLCTLREHLIANNVRLTDPPPRLKGVIVPQPGDKEKADELERRIGRGGIYTPDFKLR